MELKPCPFCGLPAKMHTTYYPSEYADLDDNIPEDAAIMREWRKPKEKKWTIVTHWMPLPEPPKEEV